MKATISKEKIFQEIKLIPEEKLADVYALLHHFRLSLKVSQTKLRPVMHYAGIWQDMPADIFAEFTVGVSVRRQQAFSGRRAE